MKPLDKQSKALLVRTWLTNHDKDYKECVQYRHPSADKRIRVEARTIEQEHSLTFMNSPITRLNKLSRSTSPQKSKEK